MTVNENSLEGRVALVTGGSRGIGRAIALAMAKAGADVMVNYVSDEESATKTVEEIRALGRKAMTFQADVADADAVNAMVGAAVEGLGKVDILVCNAGIIRRDSHVYEADLEEFREVIENHIMGAFNCVQAVLPNMRQQPRGDIQLISSTNVRMLPLGLTSYNVAKAGVEVMGRVLSKEEREHGIRVNVIGPTTTETDMASGLLQRYGFSSFREVDPYMPFGRIAQPSDTANLCAFLASEAGETHLRSDNLCRRLAGQKADAGVLFVGGGTEERDMRVEGRVALVTGASRGIGAGIARCMAQEGAAVVVNYVQSEALANQVVKEIRDGGGRAIAIQADVGNYAQVKSMVERSIAEFGKVDILVNNAGIAGPSVPMADVTPEEFEEVVRNHLIGSFNCTQCLLHHMRGLGRGDVIFISSRQTSFYPPNSSPYNAAKGGMDGLAQGLAKEERYNGIRVNVVAPGLVPTDILMKDLMATTGKDSVEEVDKVMPFGRMLRPEDIGNLCTFLASEQGSHISGEVIYVRGAVGGEPPSFYVNGPKPYYA